MQVKNRDNYIFLIYNFFIALLNVHIKALFFIFEFRIHGL